MIYTFIAGWGRSGTTLVHNMLDGHPDLVVFPAQLDHLRHHANALQSGCSTVGEIVEYFHENTGIYRIGKFIDYPFTGGIDLRDIDLDRYLGYIRERKDEVLPADRLLDCLFQAVLAGLMQENRATLPRVLKANALEIDPYRKVFPGCRFLYTTRQVTDYYIGLTKYLAIHRTLLNGRDFLRKELEARGEALDIIRRSFDVRRANQHTTDCLFLRLEDLIGEREGTGRRICEFIGVRFVEGMKDLTLLEKPAIGNRLTNFFGDYPDLASLFDLKLLTDPEREILERFSRTDPLRSNSETPKDVLLSPVSSYSHALVLRMAKEYLDRSREGRGEPPSARTR